MLPVPFYAPLDGGPFKERKTRVYGKFLAAAASGPWHLT
jgi:hypothetical protein